MNFSKFLETYKRQYVALQLSEESREKMMQWCLFHGFDLNTSYDESSQSSNNFDFHVTVFYSENKIQMPQGIFDIPSIKIHFSGIDLLGEEKNIPVLLVSKTPELLKIRSEFEKAGLKDKWSTWKPHVSLSYNKKTI